MALQENVPGAEPRTELRLGLVLFGQQSSPRAKDREQFHGSE